MTQVIDQTVMPEVQRRRNALINPDPFCPVQLAVIEHRGKSTDKVGVEVLNPKTSQFELIPGMGSIHSKDYRLIPNVELHELMTNVMARTKREFKPLMRGNTNMFWDGKRFSETWYAPSVQLPVGDSTMMMGVELRNSYDGSQQVRMAFFAMLVACTNQFHTCNMLGEPFEFAHMMSSSGRYVDTLSEMIVNGAGTFGEMAPCIKQLKAAHVEDFQGFLNLRQAIKTDTNVDLRESDLLDELSSCGVTKRLEMKNVKYNDPSSYWDIANAYTALTTHDVGGIRGSDMSALVIDWLVNRACRN